MIENFPILIKTSILNSTGTFSPVGYFKLNDLLREICCLGNSNNPFLINVTSEPVSILKLQFSLFIFPLTKNGFSFNIIFLFLGLSLPILIGALCSLVELAPTSSTSPSFPHYSRKDIPIESDLAYRIASILYWTKNFFFEIYFRLYYCLYFYFY